MSRIVAGVPENVLCLIVASSDVLSHNRVNVAEEKSERVIWYKVRSVLCPSPNIKFSVGLDRKGS